MKSIAILGTAICLAASAFCGVQARTHVKPRVFINPGHGGHDSDDRPDHYYNHGVADTVHYYESNSNLSKGNAIVKILEEKGYETATSRVTNTTADDLDLFEIVCLAANSGADMFFAIHSNATGTKARINFPLALYRGTTDCATAPGSDSIAQCIMRHLVANQTTVWTRKQMLAGDWSFYDWGPKVGLGVLRYNKLPGMLSEGSFHDYVPERNRLMDDNYCWLEAWNQSLGIDDYFGRAGLYGLGAVAGNVRRAQLPTADEGIKYGADERMPVDEAQVQLIDSDGHVAATASTGRLYSGVYVFRGVKPGSYTVRVSTQGLSGESPVVVKANQSSYCNFDL